MRRKNGAGRVAVSAVLTAISLALLYASALLPTGRMGVVAVAGLIPAAAVISGGLASGAFCWAGTSILGLLLLPDKGNALLYLIFFGIYPLVKYGVEQLRRLTLELLLKLVFFNVVLSLFWFGLRQVFLAALPLPFQAHWLVYLVGNVAFLIYDFGFSKLIAFYIQRVDRILKRGRSN